MQKGIVLDAGNNRTQSVTLEVGSMTESIQVTANAAQVETKENSISQVIDSDASSTCRSTAATPPTC